MGGVGNEDRRLALDAGGGRPLGVSEVRSWIFGWGAGVCFSFMEEGRRMSERFWLLRFKIYVFEYLFDDWIFGNE